MTTLDTCPNPSAIVQHLDQYVIGQEAAKPGEIDGELEVRAAPL